MRRFKLTGLTLVIAIGVTSASQAQPLPPPQTATKFPITATRDASLASIWSWCSNPTAKRAAAEAAAQLERTNVLLNADVAEALDTLEIAGQEMGRLDNGANTCSLRDRAFSAARGEQYLKSLILFAHELRMASRRYQWAPRLTTLDAYADNLSSEAAVIEREREEQPANTDLGFSGLKGGEAAYRAERALFALCPLRKNIRTTVPRACPELNPSVSHVIEQLRWINAAERVMPIYFDRVQYKPVIPDPNAKARAAAEAALAKGDEQPMILLAADDDPIALYRLAVIRAGQWDSDHPEDAQRLAIMAANNAGPDDVGALLLLAQMSDDPRKWYLKAAKKKSPLAWHNLGYLAEQDDVPDAQSQAIKWYELAAEKGFGPSIFEARRLKLIESGAGADSPPPEWKKPGVRCSRMFERDNPRRRTYVGRNRPPSLAATAVPDPTKPGHFRLQAVARDADGDKLLYTWSVIDGRLTGDGSTVYWEGGKGNHLASIEVDDGNGCTAFSSVSWNN